MKRSRKLLRLIHTCSHAVAELQVDYFASETDVTLESSSPAAEMRRTLPEQLLAVSRGYTMNWFSEIVGHDTGGWEGGPNCV